MKEKIAPCYHCGTAGKGRVTLDDTGRIHTRCYKCYCSGPYVHDEDKAIELWNRQYKDVKRMFKGN